MQFSVFDYVLPPVFFIASVFVCTTLPMLSGGTLLLLPVLLFAALLAVYLVFLHLEPRIRLILVSVSALLLLGRLFFFSIETSDFTDFLKPWTEWLRANGHFRRLGTEIGNYNVPYMVLLALFSCFDFPELYLIKYTGVLCDLLQAFCLFGIVYTVSRSTLRAAVAYSVSLLLPTVFINASVWGQCDSLYVSLALLAFYLCLNQKSAAGMIALGVSFAFKLQAVFLIPVFFPFLLSGRLKWRSLPLFPAAYLLAVSPALLTGRRFRDVVLFYVSSASTVGSALNYNSPSIFALPTVYGRFASDRLSMLGIALAALLCLLCCLLFLLRRKKINQEALLFAALLLTCGIPLFLPHMHDRYFYFCDVLTLAVACVYLPAAPLVLCAQFASLLGYYAYFHLRYLFPMRYGCYAMLLIFLSAGILLLRALFRQEEGQTQLPS